MLTEHKMSAFLLVLNHLSLEVPERILSIINCTAENKLILGA